MKNLTLPRRLRIARVALAGALAFFAPIFALAGNLGGPQAPIVEVGTQFYSGDSGKSLTGALGGHTQFSAESRKGYFRTLVGANFESAAGNTNIGSTATDFTMYGAGITVGNRIFLFQEGRFQPFFGPSGILEWHFLKLPAPPSGIEAHTQGISYGFEISGGVDIRFSNEGIAWRLRGGYSYLRSSLAGQSGFMLDSFRLAFGLVF